MRQGAHKSSAAASRATAAATHTAEDACYYYPSNNPRHHEDDSTLLGALWRGAVPQRQPQRWVSSSLPTITASPASSTPRTGVNAGDYTRNTTTATSTSMDDASALSAHHQSPSRRQSLMLLSRHPRDGKNTSSTNKPCGAATTFRIIQQGANRP